MPGDPVFFAMAIGVTLVGALAVVQVPKYNDPHPAFWVVLGLIVAGFWGGWALTL